MLLTFYHFNNSCDTGHVWYLEPYCILAHNCSHLIKRFNNKKCKKLNTLGAQIPIMFGFWMVQSCLVGKWFNFQMVGAFLGAIFVFLCTGLVFERSALVHSCSYSPNHSKTKPFQCRSSNGQILIWLWKLLNNKIGWKQVESMLFFATDWRMLTGSGLKSSGLYISIFQDRPQKRSKMLYSKTCLRWGGFNNDDEVDLINTLQVTVL